jgi:hypothetical protein
MTATRVHRSPEINPFASFFTRRDLRPNLPHYTMPRRRLANPATRVHLFCRALALLFELAVLIFLIYISKKLGYSNGIRYAGVGPLPLLFLGSPRLT